LGLVASVVGIVIFVFLKTPGWNFNLGGHFHPLGGWQGKGTLHSATAGGDYAMWIQFEPSQRTMTGSGPTLMGTALLCSPRGEYLPLKTSAQALPLMSAPGTSPADPDDVEKGQAIPIVLDLRLPDERPGGGHDPFGFAAQYEAGVLGDLALNPVGLNQGFSRDHSVRVLKWPEA
jgi:hypothetical protein